MELSEARYITEGVVAKLTPYCEKIMICGSIRRKKAECSDIDIVCVRKMIPVTDMFSEMIGEEPVKEFVEIVNSWTKLKGEPTGKYTQRLIDGHKLEISMCGWNNWGNMTLIRTGDSEFSHLIMKRVKKMGFEQRDGHLWDRDRMIPIYNELEYFNILNLPWIEPEHRNGNSFRK